MAELLRRGARDSRGVALRCACQFRSLATVEALLAGPGGGASVNAAPPSTRITALHTAAEHGPPTVVAALLAAGANAGATDARGWTALHYAVTSTDAAGDTDVMRVLIDGGAPVDAASYTGSTPLWIAEQNGHAAAAALLCSHGASPRAFKRVAHERITCLDMAVANGHAAVVKILVAFRGA